MGKLTIALNPAYTSAHCSNCGAMVKKALSTKNPRAERHGEC